MTCEHPNVELRLVPWEDRWTDIGGPWTAWYCLDCSGGPFIIIRGPGG